MTKLEDMVHKIYVQEIAERQSAVDLKQYKKEFGGMMNVHGLDEVKSLIKQRFDKLDIDFDYVYAWQYSHAEIKYCELRSDTTLANSSYVFDQATEEFNEFISKTSDKKTPADVLRDYVPFEPEHHGDDG